MTSEEVEKDVVKIRAVLDYHPPPRYSYAYREALRALDRLAELAHRYVGVSK